ncbi:aquaporin AQPAe.a isoform X2 [Patella vulgata]|uniref:aquaporin AQPAe.a isoform X2 n=1 Tax=Patella vulgata TaxID=6465 RepID=UPI00218050EE|nr:aquaporin AQPAe.a isoform X2 [Patella vulgata]
MSQVPLTLDADDNEYNSTYELRTKMAYYSQVNNSQLPPRNYRKLGLCEVAHMVMRVEIRTIEFWRAVISECLGTMLYVFLGCSSTLTCGRSIDPSNQVVLVALCFGFTLATLVQCFGHISGAHFNPVVSLVMALTCKVTPLRGIMYSIAQCGGSIAGAALLYGITPGVCQNEMGITRVMTGLNHWKAFGIEAILTYILVFSVFATIDPNRRELGSKPLAIGIAAALCHLAGFRFTGSAINPARSLGPAFVMSHWDNIWIYCAGPLTGGVISGLLYEYIFDPRRSRRKPNIAADTASNYPDFEDNDDITSIPQHMPTTPNHASHYNTSTDHYSNGLAETQCGGSGHCSENHYTAHLRSPERHSHPDGNYEPVDTGWCRVSSGSLGASAVRDYNPVRKTTRILD